jgi:hypothetical protein
MKYSHSKAMAVFHTITKLVKNGVLMIIHIYAKVVRYFDCDEPTNLISNTAFWF